MTKTLPALFISLLLALAACGDGEQQQPFCGDGARDEGEMCDGADLSGATCKSLGFSGGALGCKATCADYDRSNCAAPKSCGNNKREGIEKCDGTDLAGKTCEALGYGKGALSCAPNCADFDVSGCGALATCGNNKKDPGEACDGTDLGGATCKGFGFKSGTLKCGVKCLGYDKSGCVKDCVPDCKGRKCGLDPVCGTKVCGSCPANHSCDPTAWTCVKTCDLDPITANKTINVDLKVYKVSGKVTYNGGQMPDDANNYTRAYLRFSNPKNGDTLSFSLGAKGAATYSGEIFAGTYDIYLGEGSSSQKVLPRITKLLAKGVKVSADLNKDFNVRVYNVGGSVSLNGKQMPDDANKYTRAYVRFTDADSSDSYSLTLGSTGAASYSGQMFEGTYDMYLAEGSSSQKVLPRITKLLAKGVKVSANLNKNFNVKTFAVQGAVKINGKQMQDEANGYTRAYVRFSDADTADSYSFTLGSTGAANYSGQMFEGTYDLYLAEGSSSQKVLPRITKLLTKGVKVSANLTKNFDMKVFNVGGGVNLNGKQMPDEANGYTRAYVRFSDTTSGDSYSYALGAKGAATYAGGLFEGTYDMYLAEGSSSQKVLPRITHLLAKGVAVKANLVKNFNLKTVDISGTLTLNGQQMPDETNSYTRAYVRFSDLRSADSISFTLGSSGAATYSATIFAGKHDILLGEGSSSQKVLPRITTTLAYSQNLQANATRDFNLKMRNVKGTVTLNGKQMPDETNSYTRAYLRFTDRLLNDSLSVSLGAKGQASYAMNIFTGTYDLSLGEGSSSQKVLPRITLPLKKGCYSVPGCTASKKDISDGWRLVPDAAYWVDVNMTIKQSGGTLTGPWSSRWGSGTIANGKISGDNVYFEYADNYCSFKVNGTLMSGCLMNGYIQGYNTCTYPAKYSNFIGLRLQ